MVTIIIYLCIISISFFDWFYFVIGVGNRYITWIPEIVSIFAAAYIPSAMALKKKWRLPPKYSLLLFIYLMHLVTGFVLNSVQIPVVIAGLRQFCKFIPIFLIPSIIDIKEKDIRKILKLFFIIGIIQLPVTVWQRFIQYADVPSGDPVGGTLGANTSGILSLFLLVILSFLITFLLHKKLSFKFFICSFLVIFIPTTINETKITFLLLPFAFAIPLYFGNIKLSANISKVVPLLMFFTLIFVVFISVYNSLSSHYNILHFFSGEDGKITKYAERTRIGAITNAALKVYYDEPKTILFGYGAGNLSESFTKSMQGDLVNDFADYQIGNIGINKLICETGFLGAMIFFLILILIFFDTRRHCQSSNFLGTLSLSMIAFTIFFGISFFYTNVLNTNLFIYSYFFFSGYVVSYKSYPFKLSHHNLSRYPKRKI